MGTAIICNVGIILCFALLVLFATQKLEQAFGAMVTGFILSGWVWGFYVVIHFVIKYW